MTRFNSTCEKMQDSITLIESFMEVFSFDRDVLILESLDIAASEQNTARYKEILQVQETSDKWESKKVGKADKKRMSLQNKERGVEE